MAREHVPTQEDELKRIIQCGGRVEAVKDRNGLDIGPLRIWRKYEQTPGLMMSRSFGDTIAHGIGCISTPEVKYFPIEKTTKAVL